VTQTTNSARPPSVPDATLPTQWTPGLSRRVFVVSRAAISAIVALLFAGTTAHASTKTGAELLRECSATLKASDGGKLTMSETLEATLCLGYVSGFLDAIPVAITTTRARPNICPPEQGITNDQAVRLVVKYLRANPDKLHESGRMSLYIVLAKTFPCS